MFPIHKKLTGACASLWCFCQYLTCRATHGGEMMTGLRTSRNRKLTYSDRRISRGALDH